MKNKLETQKLITLPFLYPLIPQFITIAFAIISPFPKVDRKGRKIYFISNALPRKKNEPFSKIKETVEILNFDPSTLYVMWLYLIYRKAH